MFDWSCGYVVSCDKLKTLHLHFHTTYEHQIVAQWWPGLKNPHWASHVSLWSYDHAVLCYIIKRLYFLFHKTSNHQICCSSYLRSSVFHKTYKHQIWRSSYIRCTQNTTTKPICTRLSMLVSQCDSLSSIKGALSGLGQVLVTESPLKMMKKSFYFTSKALFVLKLFKLLSWSCIETAWLKR